MKILGIPPFLLFPILVKDEYIESVGVAFR
jgi:hypothetical protein